MSVALVGDVKPDWRSASVGWFDERRRLVGVGLVLLRPLPKLKRYFAFLTCQQDVHVSRSQGGSHGGEQFPKQV